VASRVAGPVKDLDMSVELTFGHCRPSISLGCVEASVTIKNGAARVGEKSGLVNVVCHNIRVSSITAQGKVRTLQEICGKLPEQAVGSSEFCSKHLKPRCFRLSQAAEKALAVLWIRGAGRFR